MFGCGGAKNVNSDEILMGFLALRTEVYVTDYPNGTDHDSGHDRKDADSR
jgi:hypothetical protein